MNNSERPFGTTMIIGLAIVSCIVTISLFFVFTDSTTRPPTYAFTIFWVCLLEMIFFGYIGRIQSPGFSSIWAPALYPILGFLYLGFCTLSIFTIFLAANNPKTYYSAIAIETLLFLIAFGLLVVFNRHQVETNTVEQIQKRQPIVLAVSAENIYNQYVVFREKIPVAEYRPIEENLIRIKDKLQFADHFGRLQELASNEMQITQALSQLSKKIEGLRGSNLGGEEQSKIKNITEEILNLLEIHNRLSIR